MSDGGSARRRSPTIYGGHPFEPSGATRTGRDGRTIAVCASCGKARNAPSHQAGAIAGDRPDRRLERIAATERHRARVARAPRVAALPREIVMLAYLLDEVLELELGPDEWRIRLRAQALRDALPRDIPRAVGLPHQQPDGHAVSVPAPMSDEPAQSVPAPHPDMPEPAPIALFEHRPVSERSRARALSKRITDPRARALATRAIASGWTLRRTGGGHWMLEQPGRAERITLPGELDARPRGWQNLRASARRLGIDVEGL